MVASALDIFAIDADLRRTRDRGEARERIRHEGGARSGDRGGSEATFFSLPLVVFLPFLALSALLVAALGAAFFPPFFAF